MENVRAVVLRTYPSVWSDDANVRSQRQGGNKLERGVPIARLFSTPLHMAEGRPVRVHVLRSDGLHHLNPHDAIERAIPLVRYLSVIEYVHADVVFETLARHFRALWFREA
jgi:hypothetical protein